MSTTEDRVKVLIAGRWMESQGTETFLAMNPSTGEPLSAKYPVSSWQEIDHALDAAVDAFWKLKELPSSAVSDFLEAYASRIESAKDALVQMANAETALPAAPRLADVELPRTVSQLRQASAAARSGSWSLPTIDTKAKIRSCYESLGPVAVFGPNNFPFAFGSVSGGDFAAAIAAGNPVIGKANSSHPGTTRIFAELAHEACQNSGMPDGLVQLIYRTSHSDGEKLVSDPRIGATGYTGSRSAGLALKRAADQAGKPIYLELSSVNPVVILPGAIHERLDALIDDYATSGLMGAGQFCTNPGLVLLIENEETEKFIQGIVARYQAAAPGTLLSKSVQKSLTSGIKTLLEAGASLLTGGSSIEGARCAVANTVMRASGSQFLNDPEVFQTEMFGNSSLLVVCKSIPELAQVLLSMEGNLTGCIYSDTKGADDESYLAIASILASKVGRLLNDKMPTGVAVSSAMNHGGPYPATGHPGFTAVGIPASLLRFAKLTCYDAVRPARLPKILRDENSTRATWRLIDGQWTTSDVASS